MRELDVDAREENLPEVLKFIGENLDELDCNEKERYQIEVAAEEIFTNISSYAYKSGEGAAKVRVELDDNPLSVSISFIDGGVQYDPLAKDDPDAFRGHEPQCYGHVPDAVVFYMPDAAVSFESY